MRRVAETDPPKAALIERLGHEWGRTGRWRIRKELGTAVEQMRGEIDVIRHAQAYDQHQVAESVVELRELALAFLNSYDKLVKGQ